MSKLSPRCTVAVRSSSINSAVISNLTERQQRAWLDQHLARKDNKVSAFDVGLDVTYQSMLSGLGTPLVNMISIALQQTFRGYYWCRDGRNNPSLYATRRRIRSYRIGVSSLLN